MNPERDITQPVRKSLLLLAADASLNENTLKGAAAGIGNIDSHGDVIFPGAFSAPVIAEFLRSGFVALGHEWDDLPIGIPTLAEERGRMIYTEAKFHSTAEAQDVRTVCSERIAAGKSVGLSVGFFCGEDGMIAFQSGLKLLEFAQANGYDLSLFDVAGISAHEGMVWGITKIARWVEYSVVTIPANSEAEAMSAKHGRRTEPISTVRELEALLRESGMPRKIACLSISNLKASLRDAAADEVPPTEEDTPPPTPPAPVDDAELTQLRARALGIRVRAMRNK